MMRKLTICLLLLITQSVAAYSSYYDSRTIQNFRYGSSKDQSLLRDVKRATRKNFRPLGYKRGAKKVLFGQIHLKRDGQGYFIKDVYCGFIVRDRVGPNRIPKNREMNAEHTWPQSKGSRREPARGDLHHLFPTHNPANSARGNHPFGEVQGKDAARNCPLSQRGDILDPKTGRTTRTYGFEPPKEHRGNVARAMFYVSAKYGYHLSSLEEFYLKKWHLDDPVDSEEMARNDAVEDAQGNRNPFIDFPELVSRIRDF